MQSNLRSVQFLTLLWFLLLTIVLSVFAVLFLRPFLWHPFGDYPTQIVNAPRGADGIPVVHLSDEVVSVTGTKCMTMDGVTITGENQWRKEEGDAVTVIAGTAGATVRKAGCVTREYINVMPERITPGIWKIAGRETAAGDGWMTGVNDIKIYESELFRIEP